MASPPPPPTTISSSETNIHTSLTHAPLNLATTVNLVRSPKAGAIVLFAGTTRDSFDSTPVTTLSYTAYAPLAVRTLHTIAQDIKAKHGLVGIAITHRLGDVGIGEESVHIVVSSPHRKSAWEAGEEALEEVKKKAEIWKREVFEDGSVWRSNRDGEKGVRVEDEAGESVMCRGEGEGKG